VTTTHERLQAVVRGRVQGVSFRYYTQAEARRLGLNGWVRNQPDGSVEVLAEGPRAELDALLAFLHRGPPAARVSGVEAHRSPALGDLGPFDVTD
jgi:acylphosphatase